MAVSFDQNDKSSWYFGGLSRAETTRLLLGERESGVFLVRDSNTIPGDYVLSVREDGRVSHYIINRVVSGTDGLTRYRIGDQVFPDMPALLAFYRLHYLDTTPLVRPLVQAPRGAAVVQGPQAVLEVVVAKYDFDGSDTDDLPFKRGERLLVINRDEEQWWTAKNAQGKTGSIPVPYVQRLLDAAGNPYAANEALTHAGNGAGPGVLSPPGTLSPPGPDGEHPPTHLGGTLANSVPAHVMGSPGNSSTGTNSSSGSNTPRSNMQRPLPAFARVRQSRVPNAYDKTALKLEKGDIVKVTKTNINGQWEGELNGKVGHFPFTHVEFVDEQPDLHCTS